MIKLLLCSVLLLPLVVRAETALVIYAQPGGGFKILTEGGNTGGAGMLQFQQAAGKPLAIQLIPDASAQCENGALRVASLVLSFRYVASTEKLFCGESAHLENVSRQRWVSLQPEISFKGDKRALLQLASATRLQIGHLIAQTTGEAVITSPIYLELSAIQSDASVLSARFDKPALGFGEVGDTRYALASARLRITKTALATSNALPYKLNFESTQQSDNQWQLRAPSGEERMPYHIIIAGKRITPSDKLYGQLPAGEVTSEEIEIQFRLEGKQSRGMAAGTRLTDRLTAVITPEG